MELRAQHLGPRVGGAGDSGERASGSSSGWLYRFMLLTRGDSVVDGLDRLPHKGTLRKSCAVLPGPRAEPLPTSQPGGPLLGQLYFLLGGEHSWTSPSI